MGNLIDTSTAAERLGITRRGVQQLIKKGILPAEKVGRDWVIDEDNLNLPQVQERKTTPGPLVGTRYQKRKANESP